MFNSFNTQPPEGGCQESKEAVKEDDVSTHSHPKVAADPIQLDLKLSYVSTHSHPKVAANTVKLKIFLVVFQHTATRRWLPDKIKRK